MCLTQGCLCFLDITRSAASCQLPSRALCDRQDDVLQPAANCPCTLVHQYQRAACQLAPQLLVKRSLSDEAQLEGLAGDVCPAEMLIATADKVGFERPGVTMVHLHTMRFGSTAKVLLKCKLKYYRISECCSHLLTWSLLSPRSVEKS